MRVANVTSICRIEQHNSYTYVCLFVCLYTSRDTRIACKSGTTDLPSAGVRLDNEQTDLTAPNEHINNNKNNINNCKSVLHAV